jgi:hypothetical protein
VTETGGIAAEVARESLPSPPAPEQLPREAHDRIARNHPPVPVHVPSLAQPDFQRRSLFGRLRAEAGNHPDVEAGPRASGVASPPFPPAAKVLIGLAVFVFMARLWIRAAPSVRSIRHLWQNLSVASFATTNKGRMSQWSTRP